MYIVYTLDIMVTDSVNSYFTKDFNVFLMYTDNIYFIGSVGVLPDRRELRKKKKI